MNAIKRTNMKPEERRNQLLDCAQILFFSNGFENTTMTDILTAANISKGGFYHHFASKEELLFGVWERFAAEIIGEMRRIATDQSKPCLTRMVEILAGRGEYTRDTDLAAQMELFRTMYDDKNIMLNERFHQMLSRISIPIIADLIREGENEGTFVVANAEAAAAMLIHLSRSFDPQMVAALDARGTENARKAAEQLQAAIDMQFAINDFILGLPSGTTHFGWPEAVEAIMALPVSADRGD